jgi:hypothetical protein
MSASVKDQQAGGRRSSDGSQNTYGGGLEEDQKTVQYKEEVVIPEDQEEQPQQYPAVLESAPFPVLASLDEITQTLSRVKSNQTQKSFKNDTTLMEQLEDSKGKVVDSSFRQTPYHTDGIRNPGWFTVLSCFLVNFYVFGTTFTWGVYQKL